jgi:hypothetical protein
MPRLARRPAPPGEVSDDAWAALTPSPPSSPPVKDDVVLSPMTIGVSFVLLAMIGGLAGLFFVTVEREPAVTVVDTGRAPTWVVGTGPLVDGVALVGEPPLRLRWSPDGKQIGWVQLDEERGSRVAVLVEVRDRFGAFRAVDDQPGWLSGPDPGAPYAATVEHGVVLVAGPNHPDGVVVDLAGQLGLNQLTGPALYHRDGRLWLAVTGHRGAPGAPHSLHVLEITRLLTAG